MPSAENAAVGIGTARPHAPVVAERKSGASDAPVVVAGTMARLRSAHVAVHEHRCVRVRNRNTGCRACADACTSGCISYVRGVPQVDASLCTGCGTCATACPTCALEARMPCDAALERACAEALGASEGTALILAERRAVEAARECGTAASVCAGLDLAGAVCVESVGRVDESLLVALAMAGAARVTLVHAVRPAPDAGAVVARSVIESVRGLCAAWNIQLELELVELDVPETEERKPDVQVEPQTKDALAPFDFRRLRVMGDGTLPHCIPDRRERLLDALADAGDPRDPVAALPARLWGRVEVDPSRCTSCRLCATFCPTGALARFDRADGAFGLEHRPADCVKCRCCEDVCRSGALAVLDDVPAGVLAGDVEPVRFFLEPVKNPHKGPHSAFNAMKGLLGIEQLYER